MPDIAHDELGKDQRQDHDHDGKQDEPEQEKQTPGKKLADDKAGAAVVKRMEAPPPPPPAPTFSVGDSGMINTEMTVDVGGQEAKLPKGTVAEVKSVAGDKMVVKLWSGFGGKEATISTGAFHAEPQLTHKEEAGKTSEPRDFVYQEYESVLWDGAPKALDVAQGSIGDCYLMAAMGAVAAANPGAIKKAFSPQTATEKSYTVTLYARDRWGKLTPKQITVDSHLPTRLQDVQRQAPVYALMGKSMADHKTPIWPALLEKAYAQMMGGYDDIGGGGYPGTAMEAITGQQSSSEMTSGKEDEVLKQFQAMQKSGKAAVCATVGSKHSSAQKGFTGAGDGPYQAAFRSSEGEDCEIVTGSLRVQGAGGKSVGRDDGSGKLTGPDIAAGTVGYDPGTVNMTFKSGKGPEKAEDLQAEYDWRGLISKDLTVYAHHAYVFESVTPDNKLQFRNPWGSYHPKAMTVADFKNLFHGSIDSNMPAKD